MEPACFGHCGDLNLHLNILARPKADSKHEECANMVALELDVLQAILDDAVAEEVSCWTGLSVCRAWGGATEEAIHAVGEESWRS